VEESGGKMPTFSGKYYYTVDPKGRIIIPASFREIIVTNYSTKLYITNDSSEKCLCIYPLEEWNKLQELVRTKPRSDKYIKYFMKRVIGSAVEIEMDKQGRVLIPAALRIDAKLNTNIVIVGQLERIELWDREDYDALFEPSHMDKENLEKGLASHGL
jgi:MraZ protein